MTPITIILPTFERAQYIREAIDSALAQTFTDFVLSIGDNSRDDNTEKVVAEYDDPRIRYRRHPRNLGQQGNWLHLIDTADTPLVASLHDDDVWHPDFLEKLVPPMLADPSISMAFADFWVIDEHGDRLEEMSASTSARTHRSVLPAGKLPQSLDDGLRLVAVWNAPQPALCAVIRRQAVLDTFFPDQISPVYDLWLSYQIVRRGEAFYFHPERLTDYRWHSGSSTSVGSWTGAEDEIFRRIVAENAASPVAAEVRCYWGSLKLGRAAKLMASPATKASSRREFRSAAPDLPVAMRAVATVAGYSGLGWHVLRAARQVKRARSAGTVGS